MTGGATPRYESSRPEGPTPESALGDALRLALRVFQLAMAGALIVYLGAGFFAVPEGSVGLVTVAGRPVRDADGSITVYGPGPHFALPPPVGRVEIVEMQAVKSVETGRFWYRVDAEDRLAELRRRSREQPLDPARGDGSLVTGDGALMHERLRAEYRIGDPVLYHDAFGLDAERERVMLVRLLEEATVRNVLQVRLLAERRRETGLAELPDRIRNDLTRSFARRGLTVTQVSRVVEYEVPRQVRAAFARRQNALIVSSQEIQKAERYRDARRADVKAEAEGLVSRAQVEARQITERAKQDVTRAAELASVVRANPSARKGLVLEALRQVAKQATVHPILKTAGGREYRIRLPQAAEPAAGGVKE